MPTKIASLYHALGLTESDPELSVLLTDDEHIQQLNAQWRGIDEPTDVLSFPLWEPEQLCDPGFSPHALGDIVISVPYAIRTTQTAGHAERVATALGVDPQTLDWDEDCELDFLLIHGLLHLLGHDHADDDEEAVMKREEARLWSALLQDHAD